MTKLNSQEQATHRTVTQALSKRLDDVELLISAVDDANIENLQRAIATARTLAERLIDERFYDLPRDIAVNAVTLGQDYERLDRRIARAEACCQERWDETAKTTKRLFDAHAELRGRTFWSRVNWLLTGR